jgi:glycerol-1-phosphate dehydrogenase [NAD(P)+]
MTDSQYLNFCGGFLFGDKAVDEVGGMCRRLGYVKGSATIVCDSVTWKIAGERIRESLISNGFETVEKSLVEKGAVREEVEKARGLIRSSKASIVFGVGGGVNIDVAKASAFIEGATWVTVPTIFAADAMTGINATFRGEEKGVDGKAHQGDYDFRVGPPLACVVDTEIVRSAPWRFQAAGFADYIAKACAIEDWRLAYSQGKTDHYSEYGVALANSHISYLIENAARIRRMERGPFEAFLKALMNDGFLTQMSGDSRILFGSEHVIGQALMEGESRMKSLHGEQVAIGTIIMSRLQGLDWKRLRGALEEIGAPTTANAIGFDPEVFVRAVARGPEINRAWMRDRPDFYTILTHEQFTEQDASKLAKETGVIE